MVRKTSKELLLQIKCHFLATNIEQHVAYLSTFVLHFGILLTHFGIFKAKFVSWNWTLKISSFCGVIWWKIMAVSFLRNWTLKMPLIFFSFWITNWKSFQASTSTVLSVQRNWAYLYWRYIKSWVVQNWTYAGLLYQLYHRARLHHLIYDWSLSCILEFLAFWKLMELKILDSL